MHLTTDLSAPHDGKTMATRPIDAPHEPPGWQVEDQCPQCGAPCLLEETDRLLVCPYCKTRLHLSAPDFFEYCLPPRGSLSETEILQVPYWRFRGLTFSRGPEGVHCGIVDTSLAALHHTFLRPSLGLKAQVLRLRFAKAGTGVKFLRPDLPMETALQRIQGQQDLVARVTAAGPICDQAFVGETLSVIYVPHVFRQDSLYDAVLERPLHCDRAGELQELLAHGERQVGKVSFLSALCPDCGWDLEAERESTILLCRNCDSAWDAVHGAFQRRPFRLAQGKEGDLYLPFWRFRADIQGIDLRCGPDPGRFVNLSHAAQQRKDGNEACWWIPAFKVRPDLFLKVARRMTVFQPEEPLHAHLGGASLHPVTLPAAEAQEALRFLVLQFAAPRSPALPGPKRMDIQTLDFQLVFLPFVQTGSEVIQEKARLGIHRNALQYGRKL